MLTRPLLFRIRTPAAIRHSSSAIERLKNPDRGGQNLTQRYRRLEQSLHGKEALQRDKRELEVVGTGDNSAITTSAAREGGYYFRGIEVPQKPRAPESDECCMSGCAVCIYDLYEESLTTYRTAADVFRSKLVIAGIPSAEWPEDLRSSTDVGISVPADTRGATLSAFEALEKALEEKKRASRPSE
ncbi:oxidoreductase-like protein [Roridomyces roridus]|uniref:Oxidoreductase-like protein n=1 Tax=Roridomyces roridus TaxID=1738132 RepID=A0AAD7BLQ2_9AGAR|nr:oxidoreductase-like protein [Roridomyces roridus]